MMKKNGALVGMLFLLTLCAAPTLFAFGKAEIVDEEVKPENPKYVLAITEFDVSGLPRSQHLLGDMITRSFASTLSNVSFRLRQDDEHDYYRDYAWEHARAAAARSLQNRRNERDLLLFKGESSLRYRRSLRTIDAAIATLEEQLAEIDARVPVVERNPIFNLSDRNREGFFPKAPDKGSEFRFCRTNNVDAFLTGRLSELHGRIYLELEAYTLHSRSFIFEESILFSSGDLAEVVDEASILLLEMVAGSLPAMLLVETSPADATVLINGAFLSRGDSGLHTRAPGEVQIEVRAENHVPALFPLELNAGEIVELSIELTPLNLSQLSTEVPNTPGSLVYQGSFFIGETPLSLNLPRLSYSYLSVETPEGEMGTVLYRNNTIVRGNARFDRGRNSAYTENTIPRDPDEELEHAELPEDQIASALNHIDEFDADIINTDMLNTDMIDTEIITADETRIAENTTLTGFESLTSEEREYVIGTGIPFTFNTDRTILINTERPVFPEDERVEGARRWFYISYGILWFALPASLLTAGIAQTYIDANNLAVGSGLHDYETSQRVYNSAILASNVQTAAYGVMYASIGFTVFHIIRYVYAASKDATPLAVRRTAKEGESR